MKTTQAAIEKEERKGERRRGNIRKLVGVVKYRLEERRAINSFIWCRSRSSSSAAANIL